jgi:hypothetical protein
MNIGGNTLNNLVNNPYDDYKPQILFTKSRKNPNIIKTKKVMTNELYTHYINTENTQLNIGGNVYPMKDNQYDLGTTTKQWKDIYFSGELYQDGNEIGIWEKNGTSIYYNDGNVGIGTSTPNEKLDIVGNIGITGHIKTQILIWELII